jgi:hypothetical protein
MHGNLVLVNLSPVTRCTFYFYLFLILEYLVFRLIMSEVAYFMMWLAQKLYGNVLAGETNL